MHVGLRLTAVLVFLAIGGGALAVANRSPGELADQTLPSPYSIDDVQYFSPGPEFKLQRTAVKVEVEAQDVSCVDGRCEISR